MTKSTEYDICNTQELIFELAIDMGFDDEDFASKYMSSKFCNREMDALYSFFQTAEPEYCMDYILDEINPRKNDKHYNPSAITWTGWIYRYLHLELNVPSKEIYKILPLKKMITYYPGMHTQDEDFFVDVVKDRLRG